MPATLRIRSSDGLAIGHHRLWRKIDDRRPLQVQCKPEKTEQALAQFEEVIAPSRAVDGVVSFDIGQDLANPDSIIAIEVFEDRAALERQESLPVVQKTIGLLEEFVAAEPEATVFDVSSSEPHGG